MKKILIVVLVLMAASFAFGQAVPPPWASTVVTGVNTTLPATIQTAREADSTDIDKVESDISALPTTTVTTNIANQITAVDAVVDTLSLRNWIAVSSSSVAIPSETYDTICTITGQVEIAYLTTKFDVALGTQTTLVKYWVNTTSISDSTADLTGVQEKTIIRLTGTFPDAPTIITATTPTVAGAPGVFTVCDGVIRYNNLRADAGTARVKHSVLYRPISKGAKVVMYR